jgi:nitrile hydratase alpha subunit
MADMESDEAATYAKIIARAWRDPAFKAKLIADPQAALKEAGVTVPFGMTVKVVENTDAQFHFVLPPKPAGELSDEALDKAAGAGNSGSATYSGDQRHGGR